MEAKLLTLRGQAAARLGQAAASQADFGESAWPESARPQHSVIPPPPPPPPPPLSFGISPHPLASGPF